VSNSSTGPPSTRSMWNFGIDVVAVVLDFLARADGHAHCITARDERADGDAAFGLDAGAGFRCIVIRDASLVFLHGHRVRVAGGALDPDRGTAMEWRIARLTAKGRIVGLNVLASAAKRLRSASRRSKQGGGPAQLS
jgi:hypothetical protein